MDANPVQSGTDLFKEFINRSLGSKLFSVPKSSPGALPSSASKAWRRYYGSFFFLFFFEHISPSPISPILLLTMVLL